MALPKYYKFVAENECGETLGANTITVTLIRWKFNSSGELVYESSETSLQNSSSIADDAYGDIGSAQDNSSNLYLGGYGMLTVNASSLSSPDGNVTLFLHRSTDNSNFDDNGRGVVLAVIHVNSATTFRRSFEF